MLKFVTYDLISLFLFLIFNFVILYSKMRNYFSNVYKNYGADSTSYLYSSVYAISLLIPLPSLVYEHMYSSSFMLKFGNIFLFGVFSLIVLCNYECIFTNKKIKMDSLHGVVSIQLLLSLIAVVYIFVEQPSTLELEKEKYKDVTEEQVRKTDVSSIKLNYIYSLKHDDVHMFLVPEDMSKIRNLTHGNNPTIQNGDIENGIITLDTNKIYKIYFSSLDNDIYSGFINLDFRSCGEDPCSIMEIPISFSISKHDVQEIIAYGGDFTPIGKKE